MDLPSDRELLDQIQRFYALDRSAWWANALGLLVEVTRAAGGFVAVDDGGPKERARVGLVPEIIDQFPDIPGVEFVLDGARIRIAHEVFPAHTLWSLHGCCEDPRRRVRLSTLARHLQLACDFAIRRGEGAPMPERVRGPDQSRQMAALKALSLMSPRAADCALLAARGYTNSQIGAYLDLNAATVARALQESYRHFAISGRAELDVATLLSLPKPLPAAERDA